MLASAFVGIGGAVLAAAGLTNPRAARRTH